MRPAHFEHDDIVNAALTVAGREGPAAASIAKIAAEADAPTGSIYHRFRSRDVLLGEVWLKVIADFQSAYIERLGDADVQVAALNAALFIPEYVRTRPSEARLMLLHRRADFLDTKWPAEMRKRAKMLGEQMFNTQLAFCQRFAGCTDEDTIRILNFAMIETPMGAVRSYLERGVGPPPLVDTLIETTFYASIALLEKSE